MSDGRDHASSHEPERRATPGTRVAVIIPAKDEERSIAATVRAARSLPAVDLVVVVDDGSADDTATAATDAGARVLRHSRNRGKGAALETGAEGVRLIEEHRPARPTPASPRHLLFLDADLGATAADAAPLVEPVLSGAADMTIALFPATRLRLGGRGYVVRLARDGIRRATGWEPEQPLNGQRCLTRDAFEGARPLAPGFGVETGMTIDVLHLGYQVVEVEVPLGHRPTGTDLRGQVHRARQFVDVGRALAARELRPAAVRGARRLRENARTAARAVSRQVGQRQIRRTKRGESGSGAAP